jgi:hypothetical protein
METSAVRPLTVTLVAWFFIIWALLSLIPKVFVIVNPDAYRMTAEFNQSLSSQGFLDIPLWLQLAHAWVGVPVMVVSGIFMLRGNYWALAVLLAWMAGVLGLTLAVSGLSMALYIKLATACMVAILLTRPAVLAWFSSRQD